MTSSLATVTSSPTKLADFISYNGNSTVGLATVRSALVKIVSTGKGIPSTELYINNN